MGVLGRCASIIAEVAATVTRRRALVRNFEKNIAR
jgi:hypothetical protein